MTKRPIIGNRLHCVEEVEDAAGRAIGARYRVGVMFLQIDNATVHAEGADLRAAREDSRGLTHDRV